MIKQYLCYLLVFGFILAVSFNAECQENRLNITVVNAESGEPVSYATISFPSQQYGFSANANGQFRLPLHHTDMDKKIAITSIGYERYETTIGQLVKDKVKTIELQPVVTMLQEILVKAEKETPTEIVAQAAKNLNNFLRKDPYYLYGLYREALKKNGRYAGYTEAYGVFHISGYQPSYNRKNKVFAYDLAQWKNVRRSEYRLPPICSTREKRLLSIDRLAKAKAEYLYNGPLTNKNRDHFRYTIDSLTIYDNADVFVIGFTPLNSENQYYGRLYIKADDYALLKMTIRQPNITGILYDDCDLKVSGNFSVSFTKVGDKYYPDRMALTSLYQAGSGKIEESAEIIGGEFRDNKVVQLNQEQRIIVYNEMLNPNIFFDPDFWIDHGTGIPPQAQEDLGRETPLLDQFFANHGKRIIPLPEGFTSYEDMSRDREVFRLFLEGDF
ncbi:hypothetical protein C900_05851 [Fulvivirga imtechensis AK7]|uniref:Carboxypeptidase-like regulatory domain-containing protein n=1 Tax=Fulvivirga imtechensis AK7 TaxID=1237149 RepID=L8JIZ0_9BACT|nr:carboxypeptidase-like regulatory domain-containing protein [Fulvivirga imtechensis]ELR68755.1 hypothetical protein C900_05851 [Fulvivirga imtechensis AK7]